jgi:hypothetical protein
LHSHPEGHSSGVFNHYASVPPTIAEYPITPYISIARTTQCGRKQDRRLKTDEKTSIEDEKMCIDKVRTCIEHAWKHVFVIP